MYIMVYNCIYILVNLRYGIVYHQTKILRYIWSSQNMMINFTDHIEHARLEFVIMTSNKMIQVY